MTRLRHHDIKDIAAQLTDYDNELLQKTGHTLRGIACHALDFHEEKLQSLCGSVSIGIVPISSGQGVIRAFSQTIAQIVRYIGFNAFVTSESDVTGIAEAVAKKAQVIMMADDQRFVALNVARGLVVDNSEATGKGFMAGLDLMTGGLKEQKVLVIGCGPVGYSAALAAIHRGAEVSVFDIDSQRCQRVANALMELTHRPVAAANSIEKALSGHSFIVEATNAAGVIAEIFITPETYIAAPGMPLGLTPAAVRKVSRRLLHDPLQLGVAVMAIEVAVSCIENKSLSTDYTDGH
ncbi:MAG: 3-methylornithyl-N6-L-lysine dehydrogenase PylD [Candidatus Aminicenantes bacterium]|nr:3-methylornithyl-N6-L-lysine dehydrogenase PylD [Candidatus Aminicenantes bacterium]